MVLIRLFEILLTAMLVLVALQFTIPFTLGKLKRELALGVLSALGTVFCLLHLLLEGLRWQMVPIYIPALICFSLGIFKLARMYINKTDGSIPEEKTEKKFSIPMVAGMVIITVLVISSLFISSQFPIFHLPRTTGEFDVGTTTFQLNDSNRMEIFTDDPSDTRKFVVKTWYPANVPANKVPVRYVESQSKFGKAIQKSFGFPSLIVSHISLVKTHSYKDVPLSSELTQYPVIIFSHGYGGFDFQNTALVEELASQGYVVFSINHVYESSLAIFPDGSTIYEAYETDFPESHTINNSLDIWANDSIHLLDQLEITNNVNIPELFWGKLDLTRIGLIGHSFGGTTAEEMALVDNRVKTGISMDSPHIGRSLELNMSKPFMLLFGQDYGNAEMNDTVYRRAENDTYGIFVEGAKHYNFADINIWSPFLRSINYIGTVDGYHMLNIINEYVVAFFNEYLKGENSPLLDGASSDYPEVRFYSKI